MGVPAFFRWISEKYKAALRTIPSYDQVYERCDWLHLDLNALIHPCTHPDFGKAPSTDEERFQATCEYIEAMVALCRPRKGLFLAMDGVAPAAKMQQQRIRRYRSVQMKTGSKQRFQKLLKHLGIDPETVEVSKSWDYNVITPGTPFMDGLAKALRVYFEQRLERSDYWTELNVIISDSNEPGEGEHKIMRFLRSLRTNEDNITMNHIVFSPDADMIPLLLKSHLPNCKVLRPRVFYKQKERLCDMCRQKGHPTFMCSSIPVALDEPPPDEEWWLFDLTVVHEYLFEEMNGASYDFERCVDDFVFLTFFVGNDFVHHLPGFGIRDGAIDLLQNIWVRLKAKFPKDYLTTPEGKVDWKMFKAFIGELVTFEDKVFAYTSKQTAIRDKIRRKHKENDKKMVLNREAARRFIAHGQDSKTGRKMRNQKLSDTSAIKARAEEEEEVEGTDERLETLKKVFPDMDWTSVNVTWFESISLLHKKKFLSHLARRVPDHMRKEDTIRYGTKGWKGRYYKEKFDYNLKDGKAVDKNVSDLIYRLLVAMQWNLEYYTSGCPSWNWTLPDFYAPAVSDIYRVMKQFDEQRVLNAHPPLGAPIPPFAQLMCVLPPGTVSTGYALPPALSELVCDETSEVSDLFHRIPIMNDYEHAFEHWQAVTKVPFPEVQRIVNVAQDLYHKVSPMDMTRNEAREAQLFSFNSKLTSLEPAPTEEEPANVLFKKEDYSDYVYIPHPDFKGFCRLVDKKDNVSVFLFRPLQPTVVLFNAIPQPKGILTQKQLSLMRSLRRYGTFDMKFTPRRKKKPRYGKRKYRAPVRDEWIRQRSNSPEFVDKLSSDEGPPLADDMPEGFDFISDEEEKPKAKSQNMPPNKGRGNGKQQKGTGEGSSRKKRNRNRNQNQNQQQQQGGQSQAQNQTGSQSQTGKQAGPKRFRAPKKFRTNSSESRDQAARQRKNRANSGDSRDQSTRQRNKRANSGDSREQPARQKNQNRKAPDSKSAQETSSDQTSNDQRGRRRRGGKQKTRNRPRKQQSSFLKKPPSNRSNIFSGVYNPSDPSNNLSFASPTDLYADLSFSQFRHKPAHMKLQNPDTFQSRKNAPPGTFSGSPVDVETNKSQEQPQASSRRNRKNRRKRKEKEQQQSGD